MYFFNMKISKKISSNSLKATAKFFGVTIDELLSGDELLNIAEEFARMYPAKN